MDWTARIMAEQNPIGIPYPGVLLWGFLLAFALIFAWTWYDIRKDDKRNELSHGRPDWHTIRLDGGLSVELRHGRPAEPGVWAGHPQGKRQRQRDDVLAAENQSVKENDNDRA